MGPRMLPGRNFQQHGFAYVAVLAMVAVMGIGLAALGPLWSEEVKREREVELLRVGRLYAEALARYQKAAPGSVKPYPPTLDVLLMDPRFAGTVRYMRALYPDPLDPARPWGLIRDADGGIRGVYSQSEKQPLRTVGVLLGTVALAPSVRYADWHFVARIE
jgi:type II secretory pathway pseudopilin PulG